MLQAASQSNTTTTTDKKSLTSDRKKNYACVYIGCQKSYYKSSHLKAHIRLHTGKFKWQLSRVFISSCFSQEEGLTCMTNLKYHPLYLRIRAMLVYDSY